MCKCDINKCKAYCCYNVPMPANLLFNHLDKMVTQPFYIVDSSGNEIVNKSTIFGTDAMVIPITDLTGLRKNKCPFLTNDCKCSIYDDRPELCKQFGHPEVFATLGCKYLGQKDVKDYMVLKVKDMLKSYGFLRRVMSEEIFELDAMYEFVTVHPEGTLRDMAKWIQKEKYK